MASLLPIIFSFESTESRRDFTTLCNDSPFREVTNAGDGISKEMPNLVGIATTSRGNGDHRSEFEFNWGKTWEADLGYLHILLESVDRNEVES